jgi:hypothetical protein
VSSRAKRFREKNKLTAKIKILRAGKIKFIHEFNDRQF